MRHQEAIQTKGSVIHHASLYDALVTVMSFGRERRIRESMVRSAALAPGQRVLDVGCGTGSLALAAAGVIGPGGYVAGIDPSSAMIARARKKARRLDTRIDFETGVAESLPFDSDSFDVVLSTFVFHHLPSDELRRAALTEMRRVLMPGGRFLIGDFGGVATSDRITMEAQDAGFSSFTVERPFPRIWFLLIGSNVSCPYQKLNPGSPGEGCRVGRETGVIRSEAKVLGW